MAAYRPSRKADGDLTQIYLYSFEHFGEAQADSYASELMSCFRLLSEQPRIGRKRPGQSSDKRLFFHGSHIIAYRITATGILIQRVLDGRSDWHGVLNQI